MPSILQESAVTSLTVMTNLHLMNQNWALVWMELVVAPKLKRMKFQPVSQVASVFVDPTIYRLRKVIREDRLYRHILVETRRKALLWNTDIRSVSKPSSFSWPWSCLCYPGPSVKTFDPDLLWQLSPPSAGNPKEVSHLVWIQCVCYLQWSNFFFFL